MPDTVGCAKDPCSRRHVLMNIGRLLGSLCLNHPEPLTSNIIQHRMLHDFSSFAALDVFALWTWLVLTSAPSLVGWRPWPSLLVAIALRLEAITSRVEAIALRRVLWTSRLASDPLGLRVSSLVRRWLAELLSEVFTWLGPQGLDFARASIDRATLRNLVCLEEKGWRKG